MDLSSLAQPLTFTLSPTCQQSIEAASRVRDHRKGPLGGCLCGTFKSRLWERRWTGCSRHWCEDRNPSKAQPWEPNGAMRIFLKGKCGTQMCGGCQELEKKSDVKHTPGTCVTYVSQPGKTSPMERTGFVPFAINRAENRFLSFLLDSLAVHRGIRLSCDQEKMLTGQRGGCW